MLERERDNAVTFASSADMQCLVSLSSTNTDKAARTKSHKMFRITAASSNTHLKSSAPLIENLFHLIAHPYNSLLQLINIINLLLIESVLYKSGLFGVQRSGMNSKIADYLLSNETS